MQNILNIKNLKKTFGDYKAVNGINFQVEEGKFFSILGPSGCGKTTLLRMIAGFLEPSAGNILINNKEMIGIPPNKRPVNLVFQNLALFPMMNVQENIAFGFNRSDIDLERVRYVAKIAEIDDFINAELADQYQTIIGDGGLTLSGGQKQRIGLARCLYHSPQIILLDEATNELDLETEKKILDNLLSTPKLTIIFITHKPSVYEQADEIVDLSK